MDPERRPTASNHGSWADGSPGRTEMHVDERPPPLPPRRKVSVAGKGALTIQLSPVPTAHVSSVDIQTQSFPDGTRGSYPKNENVMSDTESTFTTPVSDGRSRPTCHAAETKSVTTVVSSTPTLRPPGDLASLVAGESTRMSRAWTMLRSKSSTVQPFERSRVDKPIGLEDFQTEFDEIPELAGHTTDEDRLSLWKSKLKHYMILSSAGKPIWSRHGDLGLINSYMGVVQTILSFYESAKNPLLGFTAGNARFVIATEGPLYLVAISRLGESDGQLRSQLEALYMQLLSTLTLPTLRSIFVHRPSSDLRKPLQGTESLLSSLADTFTKGSPSALLGALECLKLRKAHRQAINNAFLRLRNDRLLYGLIVANGKLVSVIRPRRHSLHPSDLQIIFNMLFKSGKIRAAGGESWIPLCLPTFNNRGYLYMYVSFLDEQSCHESSDDSKEDGNDDSIDLPPDTSDPSPTPSDSNPSLGDQIAIILISAGKESFFDLKHMRDAVFAHLSSHGHLSLIRASLRAGRASVSTILPGTLLSHFLFKSRPNVQFVMAALEPTFGSLVSRRRLMALYAHLHASAHAKNAHLRLLHSAGADAASLAWITPKFELYCVAGPNISRAALAEAASQIVQWARREEERLFIIGGGVF